MHWLALTALIGLITVMAVLAANLDRLNRDLEALADDLERQADYEESH